MEILFILLPISLILAIVGFFAFRWAVRNGQFEDTNTPAMRVLFDEQVKPKKDPDAADPSEQDLDENC